MFWIFILILIIIVVIVAVVVAFIAVTIVVVHDLFKPFHLDSRSDNQLTKISK